VPKSARKLGKEMLDKNNDVAPRTFVFLGLPSVFAKDRTDVI
jgi:hypothetical protein